MSFLPRLLFQMYSVLFDHHHKVLLKVRCKLRYRHVTPVVLLHLEISRLIAGIEFGRFASPIVETLLYVATSVCYGPNLGYVF